MNKTTFSTTIMILCLCSHSLFAVDYNTISQEIKDSINVGEIFTEEAAQENIESYQGANVDEVEYYNDETSMNDSAQLQMAEDENFNTLLESSDASKEYEVDLDEDWLETTNDVISNPYDSLDVVTSSYSDCSGNQRSCRFFQGLNEESCYADRQFGVDSYHKFKCHKDRLQYEYNCTESLNLNCSNAFYSLPTITHQGFPAYSFSDTTLFLGVYRSRGSCAGIDFDFKFNIKYPAEIEELTLNRIDVDDKAHLYVNGELVYQTTTSSACELSRTSRYDPNINLKPFLKSGENSIKIKHIIGGKGNLASWFTFKYKKCSQYSSNSFVTNCSEKKFPNDSCTQTNKVCSAPNEVRNIGEGVNEFRSCWQYDIIESCTPSQYVNYCEELENSSQCSSLNSSCIVEGSEYCQQFENIYRCSDDQIQEIEGQTSYIGFFQDIESDYIDYGSCYDFDNNTGCEITNESCQSKGLKIIDGLEVDRDCWQYKRTYKCADSSLVESNCGGLESQCIFSDSECQDYDESGICIEYQRFYDCPNSVQQLDSDSQIVVCNSQVYCNNGDCDEIEYEKNNDLAKASAFASMLENAASELDAESSITFAGTTGKCSKDLLSLSDCCSMDGLFEDIIESAFSHLQWANGIGLIRSISGDETSDTGLDLSFCSSSENELYMRRYNDQCVYIGRYCSAEEDLTGLCLQEKESYCCFSSKISKIVNEQGRSQIGRGWGSPSAPDCSGLSMTEINALDFDSMDFASLEAEIYENAKDNLT
ncbi:conjugal transfer protein TraN, partial [Rickettsiales bacterium]|nr:conjugal transfer protein TraN [Rickettsiales bacterium]